MSGAAERGPVVKALTVCQPWAWAIMAGLKRVENRSWRTEYRGPLVIHAGKSRRFLCERLPDGTGVDEGRLVFGVILGVVEMVDCLWADDASLAGDPFVEGPWCWVLREPRVLAEPVMYRGQQNLFDVPSEVVGEGKFLQPGL